MTQPPVPLSPASVRAALIADVSSRLETLAARFFPGFHLPGFLNGQHVSTMDAADLAYDLAWLHKLGVKHLGDVSVAEAARRALRRVDGPRTEIFYSYRVAETLLAFGPAFADNPLLEGFTDSERENLRVATDTTAIFDPATGKLQSHYPNNYWAVLARCEAGRQRLGLLPDTAILDTAMSRTADLIFANPAGFFDDGHQGRFDIYSADVHLFCEPLWPGFDQGKLRANLAAHVALLEAAAQENGAFVAWGRSTGAMSVCLTMELGAAALRLGLTADPARVLGLVEHARQRFLADWLDADDGLIRAHRGGRTTEAYRGPQRQLQMTLDCWGKLLYSAGQLTGLPARETEPLPARRLFPDVDRLVPFTADPAARPAGVWLFRNGHLAFQLALIGGASSDYVPTPRGPGLFENPTDSPLLCALPRILAADGKEYAPRGVPTAVEKLPAGLRVVHEGFGTTEDNWLVAAERLPGRREAVYTVTDGGDTLAVEERWTFDEPPQAVGWHLPEPASRPLRLEITGLPEGAHRVTASVAGIIPWRSPWGEPTRVHQVNFTPAREIRFAYRVRPQLRVASTAADHHYVSSLYDAMPADTVVERKFLQKPGLPTEPDALAAQLDGCDLVHFHWPEWAFAVPEGCVDTERSRLIVAALESLRRQSVRVVWTMHNRRPHVVMGPECGRAFYRAVAPLVDGVIHHSAWGMGLMQGELPFNADAEHTVIPHGHFGAMDHATGGTREELEKLLGLPPCATRFGVLGRPQREKQAELIVRAFRAGARPDQQLLVTAGTPDTLEAAGDDPRVIVRVFKNWLTREEIAAQLHACDALVSAHTGESYLTSGTGGDAIGNGLGMLAPDWEFFRETLGDAALYHDNTEAGLAALFARVTPGDITRSRTAMAALRPDFDWPPLAERTLALFRRLGRK